MSETLARPERGVRASYARHPAVWTAASYAALAVVCAAFGVVGLWSVFTALPGPVSSWWSLPLGLAAAALVPFRHRAPWTALTIATALWAVDLVTVGGLVPLVVLLDVLYAAVVQASAEQRQRVRRGIVAVVLLLAAAALIRSGDVRISLLIAVQLGALIGMTYWYATSVAQSTELLALHQEKAADAALLAAQERIDAVHREREDMARELHDLVAGHVSAMAIRAEAALSGAPDPDRDRAALQAVRDSSLEAHAALRSMIAVLRAGPGAPLAPLRRDAVPALVADARRSGLRVEIDDEIAAPLAVPVDQAVTRIVQEALANCARHAAGSDVRISLAAEAGDVRVRIDSRGGAPLDAPALTGSGWGLELLAERARALGGRFDAGPVADGWTVRAVLPREVRT